MSWHHPTEADWDRERDYRKHEPTYAEIAAEQYGRLIRPQIDRYNQRMADAAPYKDSPRWDRMKADAYAEFFRTTVEAVKLYAMALHDLETIGVISEATAYAFDQAIVAQVMAS
jgi:hypothetical protein